MYNHGPTRGISDSLDAMSEWVATVRAPIMPAIAANTEAHGRAVFHRHLRELPRRREVDQEPHERALYQDNPLLQVDPIGPAFFTGVRPRTTPA